MSRENEKKQIPLMLPISGKKESGSSNVSKTADKFQMRNNSNDSTISDKRNILIDQLRKSVFYKKKD